MKLSTVISSLVGTLSLISHAEGNMKLLARERMREDRAARDRMLSGESDSGMVFSRGYVCIIKPQDFTFAIPTQKSQTSVTDFASDATVSSLNLVGSSSFQSGGIYDPADVEIVDRLGGSTSADDAAGGDRFDGPKNFQFAGQRQPKFIPQADPGFFLNGECVTTQAMGFQIMGHSCLLNLCLGGGGYNCLAIYAGSKFVFNPVTTIVDTGVAATGADGTPINPLFFGARIPTLPPSYPGTIIGGTGLFNGAVGYVDITTITGSTTAPVTSAFAIPTGGSKPEFVGDNAFLEGGGEDGYIQVGFITQKINVVTNIPLPVAP